MIEDINEIYEDAESSTAIDDIDIEFIIESIREQVSELMESSSKRNYLKVFENRIENSDLTEDDRETMKETMYSEIIDIIAEKFNIEIFKSSSSNRSLAKNLYKFFVINYNDNVEQFLEIYIIENKKDIVEELERREINSKRIEGINSKKIAMILNNISFVIDIIANANISFEEFLEYISRHPESKSSTEELLDYLDDVIDETDDLMKFIMDQLVNEEEGFGNIYTELQRRLFERFNTMK